MSSMFKKKSGAGFKPKAPIARPRPTAASQTPRSSQTPIASAVAESSTIATNSPAQDGAVDSTTATTQASAEGSIPTGAVSASLVPINNSTLVSASPGAQASSSISRDASREAPPSNQQVRADQPTASGSLEAAPKTSNEASANDGRASRYRASAATPALQAPDAAATSRTETSTTDANTPITTPDDQPPAATASKPKKPTARKPRKRAAPSTGEEDAGESMSTVADQDGTEGADGGPPKKRARKPSGDGTAKPRKRKQSASGASPGDTVESEPTPRRRVRSATPEDAEYQQVDLSSMTMADLTKDLRIGKKSRVHDMLLAREREKIAAMKLKKAGLASETDSPAATPAPTEEPQSRARFLDYEPPVSEPTGLQYTMIGGQIVVDQSSLSLDRHERARQQQLASGAITAEMEEDDFTNHITQTSFRTGSKLRGPNYWNDEDTELFYRGIGMLGTDFTLICKMFPGRSRRHVKMKFNREEKLNPVRINAALTGKKSMQLDIDEYKQWTKSEYEPVADIMAAYQAKEAEFKEKTKLLEQEKEETNRRKKEALFADEEGAVDGDEGDEGGRKKKGKKKRKNAADANMWGEVVEETPIDAA